MGDAGDLQDEGGQGESEGNEEAGTERRRCGRGRKSRVQERDVGEEGLHLCGARGGAVRGRESDRALYPIRKAVVSGCSDSEFDITNGISKGYMYLVVYLNY